MPVPHPLLEGIADLSEFYFVHSYYPSPADPALAIGVTEYAGVTFASMVGRANVAATLSRKAARLSTVERFIP